MTNNIASFSRVTKEFRSASRKIMIRYCSSDEVCLLRYRDIDIK